MGNPEEWFGEDEDGEKGGTFDDLHIQIDRDAMVCSTCNGAGTVSDGLPSNGPQPCPKCGHV